MTVDDVRDALQAVIDAHSTTIIIYDGGSAPGTARAIAPISLTQDKLIARCLESNKRKTFVLSKVRMAGAELITPRPMPAREDMARLTVLGAMSLSDLLAETRAMAECHGWHLTLANDTLRGIRGREQVYIAYMSEVSGIYFDADGNRSEVLSERPWHVNGCVFAHKARAFAAFQDALTEPPHDAMA
jgi:hypothetical protein